MIPYLLYNIHFRNIHVELKFNESSAYKYLKDQININSTHYRIPGTQGREECAKYFISKFQEIGSNFSLILHNFTVDNVDCQNVLFKFNENQPNILILGSHYDSRAKATKDSTNPNSPVPGANDGASGSAVLIELARSIYNRSFDLTVQIWFLFFDAEDQGYDWNYGIPGWDWCEGSKKFVEDIESFYNSTAEYFDAMILLDMVGGTGLKFINEQYSTSSLLNELFEIGRQMGYRNEFPFNSLSQSITDDHISFVNYGIPSADLIINFWNNPHWPYHHTIEDNLFHISNFSLEVTGRTIEQFIYNNYLESDEEYQGNFPWKGDLNLLDTTTFIIILTLIIIIGLIIIITILKRFKRISAI